MQLQNDLSNAWISNAGINDTNKPDPSAIQKCDDALNMTFELLGTVGNTALAGFNSSVNFNIIHRPNGNILLASRGLSHAGYGLELVAEASASEVMPNIEQSYLYQMIDQLTGIIPKQFNSNLMDLLDTHGTLKIEMKNLKVPLDYMDPMTGNSSAIIGIESPSIPEDIELNGNNKIKLVTIRLITHKEAQSIEQFGKPAKDSLIQIYKNLNTHHVSSIGTNPIIFPQSAFMPLTAPLAAPAPLPAPAPQVLIPSIMIPPVTVNPLPQPPPPQLLIAPQAPIPTLIDPSTPTSSKDFGTDGP